MKKFINSLRDFRTYTADMTLVSVDPKSKTPKKGNLILFLGNIPNEDLFTTLRSGVLSPLNFRSIYKPRNFYSSNKKLKKLNMQKDYYQLIQTANLPQSYDTRLHLQAYMGRNLIIDITDLVALETESLPSRTLVGKARALKNVIAHLVDAVGYENTTLLVQASTKATAVADGKVFADNFTLLVRMLRRHVNFLPDGKVDNLIFYNPDKRSLLKMATTEENINEVFMGASTSLLINRLLMLSNVNEGLTGEEEDLPDPNGEEGSPEGDDQNKGQPPTGDTEPHQKVDPLTQDVTGILTPPDQGDTGKTGSSRKPSAKKQIEVMDKVDRAILQALTLLPDKIDAEKKKELSSAIEKTLTSDTNLGLIDPHDGEELLNAALRANPEISDQMLGLIKEAEIGSNNVKRQHTNMQNQKKMEDLLSSDKLQGIILKAKENAIEEGTVQQVDNINPEMNKSLRTKEFDKSYAAKKYMNDILNVFTNFAEDEDIPMKIVDFQVEESSDDQTSKETIYVTLRDDLGNTHKVSLDVPKVYDGKYIKVNGGKKIINKMFVMLPIVKTKPTEVWITTDYNKLIVERFGRKTNSQVDYLAKVLEKMDLSKFKVTYRRGNSATLNANYKTSLEYNELSQQTLSLEVEKYRLIFNQKLLKDEIESKGKIYTYDSNKYFPVGFYSGSTIVLSDITDGTLYLLAGDSEYRPISLPNMPKLNLSTFIIMALNLATDGQLSKALSQTVKANESLTFSRVKIINKRIPMIILLAHEIGLFKVLDRYNVRYTLYKKEPRISVTENKSKIKFSDGWLVYDSSKIRNTLLLAGLRVLHTEEYTISEFNGKTPYLDYFQNEFNSRNVAKGIHNAMTLMLDPITKEILASMELPTNIIDLLLTANTMLEDSTSKQFNDMNIYRMRGTEQVPALLYKIIADSYKNYKDSMNNRNPAKVSIPKNALIKGLMELSTVDEMSDLNPSLEIDKQTSVTYRGVSGRNNSDSYTEEIRGYDKSMEGILGILTPDSATVGVVRKLSTNPNIKSVRGFLDTSGDTKDSTAAYTPLELLNSYTSRHADPPRKLRFIGVTLCLKIPKQRKSNEASLENYCAK